MSEPGEGPTRVLVVDDSEDDYVITRDLLSNIDLDGYQTVWAETYEEALTELLSGACDVCLVDYRLGARSGLELLKEAVACGCTVPITLLTGAGDDAIDRAAMLAGAADYLVKNELDARKLERTLRYALTRTRADEALRQLVAIARDNAERQQAERATRESSDLLRAIVDGALDTILLKDLEGRYLICNTAWAAVFGRSVSDVVGRLDSELLPAETAREVRDHDLRVIRSGCAETFEHTMTIGGVQRVWLTTRSLYTNAVGKLMGIVSIGRDITDHKAAEAALRTSDEHLRQAQKMEAIGRLAGGVAHDFNNMLSVINGYSSLMLSSQQLPDLWRMPLEEILSAGERAASMTRQLLVFSRKEVVQPRNLALNQVVEDVQRMLLRMIGEDVALRTDFEPALWALLGDSGQIDQILMNLALNARDAMPTGGELRIQTRNVHLETDVVRHFDDLVPGPYVLLSVADTGCGMTAEVQARIFEPFFTTKPEGEGTGLGLATVYGIVKQMKGCVNIYSEVGLGTTVNVYLPRAEEPADAQVRSTMVATLLPRGSETILLVEDEEMVRNLARTVLLSQGYKVLQAAQVEEALQIANEFDGPIHLLLTDIVMPGKNGRMLAEELQKTRPQTRILFMSGYTADAVVRHGIMAASTAFMQKPLTPAPLALKIREVLDARPPRVYT